MQGRPYHDESYRIRARSVPLMQPVQWLRKGWRDFAKCPLPGAAHGMAVALFGALLIAVARERFWLLAGAFSGFLLVAPVVATGLYRISRDLQRGQRPGLADVLQAWRPDQGQMVVFGMLLAAAGTGWVLTSASLITGFSETPIRNPQDFLKHVVLDESSVLFLAWLGLGAVMAAPVFASSVVAMPLMLDRKVGVMTAVLASWKALLENPLPMAMWATLIMALTALGMAAALAGLVFVVPWLAHASWHAYLDLVDASHFEARD